MNRGFLLRQLAAACGAVLLAGFSSPPVAADGNAGLFVQKTVDPAQVTINPNIGVTLAVDKTTAIPGDTLTYTATVTNPTATLAMGGEISAEAHADADATVAYYWDELEVCGTGCGNGIGDVNWKAVATFEATQPGYTPVTTPQLHTGMSFAASPITRTGVVYPTSGDPILGTVISPSATGAWTYLAKVTVTPAQIATLADLTQVTAMRNVIHMEVTVRNTAAAQPWTDPELFTNPFTTTANPGAIANVSVKFTLPDGTTTQVAATPSLAPGASASATAQFKVPVPAPHNLVTEADADYITRLAKLNGATLTASAVASGAGFSGTVYATSSPITTTEFVPIVLIAKSGPSSVDAGTTETNPLSLQNVGGAGASTLAIVDTVPASPNGAVTGTPASLAPNAVGSATATFAVPVSQAEGSLTDTASVTWQDANSNPYGPLSSAFTTTVHNVLFGAILSLAPVSAGPNPIGSSQALTATLVDRHSNPIPNQVVTFTITGANPGTGTATTDASGNAVFTYTGANTGNDTAIAKVSTPGITLTSNTSTISWGKPLQPVATTQVQGNFFPNPNDTCTFSATGTPAFAQTFPDILFNSDQQVIPHDISSVGPGTHPFTDKTVDVNGNFNGLIVAQGNGLQAGVGQLGNFFAVFTGSFVVTQAGDVTFTIIHDDGYILGVGNGATRVNGEFEGNPPATTPFNGYGVVAAWNQGGNTAGSDTVHFPAPGTYPYEIDYTECNGGGLQLVLNTAKFIPQTDPLSIYVGYADGLRAGGSIFPFPWQGSPGVTFIGGCTFDAGAIRFDNSGNTDITLDKVTVDLGSGGPHFDLWGPNPLVVPAHGILILTQTGCFNFDTSDFSNAGCGGNNNVLPLVNVTRGGVLTTFTDTGQILNTHGFDSVCQGNESIPWQRIAGQANTINVPLPPAVMLDLMPFNIPTAVQGQSVSVTVSALDGAGNPQVNLPVGLHVTGANAQNLTASTNTAGLATFTYPGNIAGTDSLQATAFPAGVPAISNQGTVVWSPPGGTNNPLGATITNVTPADGAIVTKPVAIDASIAPPAGQSITSWKVFYQALDPGTPVTIASGSGAPPSPIATFDPTVVPNDTYSLTVQATSSNGAVQSLTTTVAVVGALKPGRFVTDYQDLVVPVGGFQMEVRRSYDSIDKNAGDFGVGWKVSVANFRTASNRVLGAGGWAQFNKSCVLGLCFTAFKNSAPRYVTVTYPDQHTEVFDFTPQGGTNLFWSCTPQFTARSSMGSTSKLEPLDDTACSYTGDGNLYGSAGLYAPKQFKLTLRDGRTLVLDSRSGLLSESDASGNTLSVTSAGVHTTLGPASNPTPGPSITFTRDSQGRITDVDGPVAGQHLHYSYFASGPNELQTFTNAAGHSSTYSYDATTGNLVLAADQNNQPVETLRYDSSGRLVSVANGSAPPTTISTSPNLQQQVFLSPSGNLTTVLTFDDLGDVVEQDLTYGGNPALKTTFTYDAAGRLTSVTDPLQHTTSATYDETDTPSNGNQLTSTDAAGRTYTFKDFTRFGQPGTVLKPDSTLLMSYAYDQATGLLIAQQRPGENPTTYQYYPNGLLQSVTEPGGRVEQYTYDANGHVHTAADSQNRSLTFNVDAAGNVTSSQDQLGNTTFFQYNGDGSLAILTDADHNSWQYFYDVQGRMKEIRDPFGKSTFYAYNSVGQLSQRTDRNGAITGYVYDTDGNLTRIVRPNNDVTNFTYDPLSRLVEADNASSHVDRAYDAGDSLISETTCANTGSPQTPCSAVAGASQPRVTLTYSWFPDGTRKSVTSSDSGTIQYAYDPLGRLSSITDPALGKTAYSYNALDEVTSIARPNGVNEQLAYNASGDLISRDAFLNGNMIARSEFTIDPVSGRRASSTNLSGTTTYTYFDNGSLQSVTRPAASGIGNEIYTYDAAGNRTSANGVLSTYGGGQLQSDGQFNYAYDANGQLTSRAPVAGGPATGYSWDAEGQLSSITYPNGTSSQYRYDPFGRRIASVDPGGETRYVWDDFSVLGDYTSQNQLSTSYVPGPTTGAALEQTSASQTQYFLADGQNNPSALTNSSGQVVGTYAFNAFGVSQAGNASSNRYSFGGYQLDSASGLYYAGARYYDPSTGRFLSRDPKASANPYPYALNDPVDLLDPLGQQALNEFIARVKAVILEAVTFLVRVGCGLLNLLFLLGLVQFALEGLSPNAKGQLGEKWLKWAMGGQGDDHPPIDVGGGRTRIPDRGLRLGRWFNIFLDSKNAAELDARSIAQLSEISRFGPIILLTRGSLARLPGALAALARDGLIKWVKCFPA